MSITLGAKPGVATVEWEASPAGDVIADSLVALLMHAQSSAASIRLTSKPCRHPRDANDEPGQTEKKQREDGDTVSNRLRLFHDILKEQFENVEAVYDGKKASFEVRTDTGFASDAHEEDGGLLCTATVEFLDDSASDAKISVESKDEKFASNVQGCLRSAASMSKAV